MALTLTVVIIAKDKNQITTTQRPTTSMPEKSIRVTFTSCARKTLKSRAIRNSTSSIHTHTTPRPLPDPPRTPIGNSHKPSNNSMVQKRKTTTLPVANPHTHTPFGYSDTVNPRSKRRSSPSKERFGGFNPLLRCFAAFRVNVIFVFCWWPGAMGWNWGVAFLFC